MLRHVTRERQSPDSSFASLPSIASRALSVRPRVRPQPVWRLRVGRTVAAAAVILLLLVVIFSAVNTESPYRVVANPLKERIHFGKDNDTPAVSPSTKAQADTATEETAASSSTP